MNILHISPHLGGGVGRFICNTFSNDKQHNHTFVLLERPIDVHLLEANPINWLVVDQLPMPLSRFAGQFDVVQIEFWNHPLLFKFLCSTPLPDCRVIVYSHVSGLFPPNLIPEKIIDFCDWMVLSTPATTENLETVKKLKNYSVIHGLGGISRTKNVSPKSHSGTIVSYIGTASYSKLHEEYINICNKLLTRNNNIHFLFASNDSNDHLLAAADNLNISDKFSFHTKIPDIIPILEISDIFGYPLRSDHFGTGEQVILEAIGAGIPPVVFDNPAERYLIQDGKTGVVARNIEEYVNAINFLIEHPNFRKKLGMQAKKFAELNFAESKTLSAFHALYDQVIELPKSDHFFVMNKNDSMLKSSIGWELFNLCLGDNSLIHKYVSCRDKEEKSYLVMKIKNSPGLVSNTKGGLYQYLNYFPNDPLLLKIERSVNEPVG